MSDWFEEQRIVFAGAAVVLATGVCVYLAIRAPRNMYTRLFIAIAGCVAVWNAFEWLRLRQRAQAEHEWAVGPKYMAVAFLPGLLVHFALSVVGRRRARTFALVAVYALGAAFAAVAAFAIEPGPVHDFVAHPDFNRYVVLAALMPALLLSIVLLLRGALTGPRELRGVQREVAVAAVVGFAIGLLDQLHQVGVSGIPAFGNLGASIGCAILAFAAWRHREVFDSLAILRTETARLLERTRHGIVSFDVAGAVVFSSDLAAKYLGAAPRTLADVEAVVPGLTQDAGPHYFSREGRVFRVTMVGEGARVSPGERRHALLEERTEEARRFRDMSHRDALAALGEGAATVVHEVRNAMTTIGTTIDTLSREERPDPARLADLHGQVRRLNVVLAKCLALARAVTPEPQRVDLARVFARIAESGPPGLALRFEVHDGAGTVDADPDLLTQLFANVVQNAADAGAHEVRAAASREGGETVVRLVNDGRPIAESMLPRLFEPFASERREGTGLGLALCRKIAGAHGGRIDGRNVPGGVEFEVRLPWTS